MSAWTSPTMTSNTAPSPYVTSANSVQGAYYAWKSMDGSASTYWEPTTGVSTVGAWWKIYVGGNYRWVNVTTITFNNYATYGLKTWKLQGSNDDSAWVDIYSGSCTNDSNIQTFNSLGNSNYYKYYRVWCLTSWNATDLAIYEITMSGDSIIGHQIPVVSTTDTALAPFITHISVPATAQTDTFVSPVFGRSLQVSAAESQVDTFVAPSFKAVFHVPVNDQIDVPLAPVIFGMNLNKFITFPNLSGKHLSLKYYNEDADSGFVLYQSRMKMFKSIDRVDFNARHPNLSGNHLTLKLLHESSDDFLVGYSSMGMFKTVDRVDSQVRHPNLSGNHLSLKVTHSANEEFDLAYSSMGLMGRIE
jgi:hypothetical protein